MEVSIQLKELQDEKGDEEEAEDDEDEDTDDDDSEDYDEVILCSFFMYISFSVFVDLYHLLSTRFCN